MVGVGFGLAQAVPIVVASEVTSSRNLGARQDMAPRFNPAFGPQHDVAGHPRLSFFGCVPIPRRLQVDASADVGPVAHRNPSFAFEGGAKVDERIGCDVHPQRPSPGVDVALQSRDVGHPIWQPPKGCSQQFEKDFGGQAPGFNSSVCARSGPTLSTVTGTPTASSMKVT